MFKHGFPPEWSTFKKLIWLVGSGIAGASYIWKTVTGALIHLTDALASPVRELSVAIEPQQSGSGDPSPTNVRPITGWTGANMAVAGVNIAPSSVPSNVIAGTFSTSNSKIFSAENARVFAFRVPKNTSIYVQKKNGSTSGHVIALGDTGSIAVGTPIYSPAGFTNATGANLNTGEHDWIYIQSTNLTVANALFSSEEFMVSVGSSRKDYEAPQGTTYPISWQTEAGTVHGGTLTVNEDGSADLVSEWNGYEFDGSSDENWKVSSNIRYWIAKSGIVYNRNSAEYIKSNKLKSVSAGSLSSSMENCCYIGSDPFIGIVKSSISNNVTNFRAFLAENPVTIIAKRTTPLTYHFDSAEQISTLAGENNIWADVNGEITLTYQAVPETAFSDNADTGMADYMTLTE